jgi:hypothetical protein
VADRGAQRHCCPQRSAGTSTSQVLSPVERIVTQRLLAYAVAEQRERGLAWPAARAAPPVTMRCNSFSGLNIRAGAASYTGKSARPHRN